MQAELIQGAMYCKAYNPKTRSVDAVISSEAVDGHGEIIDQSSWNLARYAQNPVVLYMHSHYDVIGHAQDVRVADGQLQARIVFATTKLASEVATLFQDGAMRAFSVGFRAGRIETTIVAGKSVRRLMDCELREISAVSVPSNPDAVVKHKSLGLVPANYQADAGDELIRAAHAIGRGDGDLTPTGDDGLDLLKAARRAGRAGAGFDPFTPDEVA